MIKSILHVVLILAAIAYLAEIKISLRPFHLQFTAWRACLGMILICAGTYLYRDAGYRRGHNDAIDEAIDTLEKFKKEKHERNTDSI